MWQVLQYLNHPGGSSPDFLQFDLEGPNSWYLSRIMSVKIFEESKVYEFVKAVILVLLCYHIHGLNLCFM